MIGKITKHNKTFPCHRSAKELQVALVDGIEVLEGDGSGARATHIIPLILEGTSCHRGIFIGAAQKCSKR